MIRDCDSLCLASLAKSEEDNAADYPRCVAGGIGQTDEPVEDHACLIAAVEIRKQAKAAAGRYSVDR